MGVVGIVSVGGMLGGVDGAGKVRAMGIVDVGVVGDAPNSCSGNSLSSFSARQMSLHLCT